MIDALHGTVREALRREGDRLARFAELAFPARPPRPRWATRNSRVFLRETVDLRLFGSGRGKGPRVLVVTPQVNHSYIADYSPSQSLVRTLLAAGASRVAVTDWLAPPPWPYSIAHSIDDIVACLDHLGGRSHLVGLCQGGWQSAIVAALHPDQVSSLVVAAAPIDTHAGDTPLNLFVRTLPTAWFEWLVIASGGVAPGETIARGFDLLRPHERFFLNYVDLYRHLDEAAYCRRWEELRNWYRLNKDVAGQLYVEVVRDLFKRNLLARNLLEIRGRRVELSRIECPVHLVAGSRDHITPSEQVFALERMVPRAAVRRYLVEAGHIGIFIGHEPLATVWPEIMRAAGS
jgi:poly(3-hydroxyalkanoate) synthetase